MTEELKNVIEGIDPHEVVAQVRDTGKTVRQVADALDEPLAAVAAVMEQLHHSGVLEMSQLVGRPRFFRQHQAPKFVLTSYSTTMVEKVTNYLAGVEGDTPAGVAAAIGCSPGTTRPVLHWMRRMGYITGRARPDLRRGPVAGRPPIYYELA